MRAWAVVAAVGIVTIVMKGSGPLLLGGRPLPPAVVSVFRLLPPALFAALIVTQAMTRDRAWTIDARAAGLVAAIAAASLRARPALVLLAACATTAALRLLSP